MALTVTECLKLNHLKPLTLVAGAGGLGRLVEKVGILDYELVEGISGFFTAGDFVLTTFTPLRDDFDAIESSVRALIECGISALAVKNIYVKKLPQAVIDLGNAYDLPIFLFEEGIFFEDIIEDLATGLRSRGQIEEIESKLEALYRKDLSPSIVETVARELNEQFYPGHQVFYLEDRLDISGEKSVRIAERYRRSRHRIPEHSVFKYRNGLVVVMSYLDITNRHIAIDFQYLMDVLGIDCEACVIGSSLRHESLETIDRAIVESLSAFRVALIEESGRMNYRDIGIYKLLVQADETWMTRYVRETLGPIYEYEKDKFIETARIYARMKGDIAGTADALFQHKNTIRYRINKMKEMLGVETEGDFYTLVSTAIGCEKLLALASIRGDRKSGK